MTRGPVVAAAERRARRRDRQGQLAVVVVAIVAGVIAAAVGAGDHPATAENQAGDADQSEAVAQPAEDQADLGEDDGLAAEEVIADAPSVPVVLVGHRGNDGRVGTLALYGFPPGAPGAALIVPPTATAEVPTMGMQQVADVDRLGSEGLLELTLENVLGVQIAETVLLDDAQLGAVFAPTGVPTADLASDSLRADTLEAWRVLLRDPVIATEVGAIEARLATFLANASAEVTYATLPLDLAAPDAESVVVALLGDAIIGQGAVRARVEIRDGVGDAAAVLTATALVVSAGGEVVSTSNVQGFGVAESSISYGAGDSEAIARRFAPILGIDDVVDQPPPPDGIDVSIVVGTDFSSLMTEE